MLDRLAQKMNLPTAASQFVNDSDKVFLVDPKIVFGKAIVGRVGDRKDSKLLEQIGFSFCVPLQPGIGAWGIDRGDR